MAISIESDEDDYMSDAILKQCAAEVVPSSRHLIGSLNVTRQKKIEQKRKESNESNKEKFKPFRVLEEEARNVGLNKQIGSENKGFQLLSKMGYKPGTSLGKRDFSEPSSSKGLKEPIMLEVKSERKGLGQKTKNLESIEAIKKRRQEFEQFINPEEFRQRTLAAANLKAIKRDVRKAQSVCRNLDSQHGIEVPNFIWYWTPKDKLESETPSVVQEVDDDEVTETHEPEPEDILTAVTEYLRTRYLYCIWCGTTYDSETDLQSSCPGNSRDDH